jgi:hypothetical protein
VLDEAHRARRLALNERHPRAWNSFSARLGGVTADPEVKRLSLIPPLMPSGNHLDEIRVLGERIDRDDPPGLV